MKTGQLAKVVTPKDAFGGRNYPTMDKTGIVLSRFEHPSATCGLKWYTVLVEGATLNFREDYLEAV